MPKLFLERLEDTLKGTEVEEPKKSKPIEMVESHSDKLQKEATES
jgi:hypothetical protein